MWLFKNFKIVVGNKKRKKNDRENEKQYSAFSTQTNDHSGFIIARRALNFLYA